MYFEFSDDLHTYNFFSMQCAKQKRIRYILICLLYIYYDSDTYLEQYAYNEFQIILSSFH